VLFLGLSFSGFSQFQSIGPIRGTNYNLPLNHGGGMGQIHSIVFPPFYNLVGIPNNTGVIYCGSPYSGLWKSTNSGNTWASVAAVEHLPTSSVNDIVLTNDQNYTIYITTGGESYGSIISCGLWKSTDFGHTFQSVTGLNDVYNFNIHEPKIMTHIAVSPFDNDFLLVASSDGIYRSLDAGSSWDLISNLENFENELSSFPGFWTVEFSKLDPDVAYCSGMELYKIDDVRGGTPTINTISNQVNSCTVLPGTNINFRLYLDPESLHEIVLMSGYYVYDDIACANHNDNAVYKYDSYDDAWELLSNSQYHIVSYKQPTADRLKIAADPDNLNKIMAGYTETKITQNNGNSWNTATGYNSNGHADIHAIEFAPDGSNTFWVGTDGGIYKYNVATGIATETNNGFATNLIWQLSTSRLNKNHIAIGKQDANGDWFDGTQWRPIGNTGGDGYPPVLWDKSKKDELFLGIGAKLHKFSISTNVIVNNNQGCTEYSNIIQNADPNENDEFFAVGSSRIDYKPQLSPFRASIARSRNQFYHASDFKLMDSIWFPNNDYPYGFAGVYMSTSNKNRLYTWNYFGHPNLDINHLYRINTTNFDFNTNVPTNCTSFHTKYDPTIKFDKLLYLPKTNPNYYTTTIACSLAARNVWHPNTELAKMHNMTDVAISNVNDNKIWVSLNHNLLYRRNVPSFVVHTVRKSTDGGQTWSDDSVGLPKEPIMKITYVDGSNDLLFCATATGRVFYKDTFMTSWLELDPNLPHCQINTLEVNYCTKTLHIATYGRGVWRYDLTQGAIAQRQMTIGKNETWSNRQFDVGTNIVVKKGKILTINSNSIINMCKDCKIVLEVGDATTSGGQLHVVNATLTNLCGEYWKGIEVQGDVAATQIAKDSIPTVEAHCKNARCFMTGAIIENMYNGIINYSPSVLPITYGGQILAVNTKFNNNRYSLNFNVPDGYQPSKAGLPSKYYQSKAELCTFINKNRTDFVSHIYAYGVRGLAIFGNTFVDSASEVSTAKGYGIWTINSSVEVVPLNNGTSYVKNIFRGLTYGIYMSGNAPNQLNNSFVTKIARANFIDNTYAIYLNAISNPIVIEDSIKVAIVSDPMVPGFGGNMFAAPNKSFGLYLTGCTNYKVQDNQIYTSRTPGGTVLNQPNSYGILVSNGHTANEKIRRNTFTQLRYAAVADGQNGVASGNQGLLFQCNNFIKSEKYDLWLTGYQFTFGGTTYTINGVIPNQGMSLNDPFVDAKPFASHNTFQQYSVSLPQFQLIRNNLSSSYTYFYFNDPAQPQLNPLRISTTYPILKTVNGVTSPCTYNIIPGDYTPTTAKKEVEDIFTLQNAQDKKEKWWIQQLTNQHDITNLLIDISENPIASAEVIKACIPLLKNETNYDAVIAILSKQGGADLDLPSLLKSADIALKFKDWQMLKTTSEGQTSPYALWQGQLSARLASIEDWVKYTYDKMIEKGEESEAAKLLHEFEPIENIALFASEQKIAQAKGKERMAFLTDLKKSAHPSVVSLANYYADAEENEYSEANLKKYIEKGDFIAFKAISKINAVNNTTYHPYLPDAEADEIQTESKDEWKEVKRTKGFSITVSPVPADDEIFVTINSEEQADFIINLMSTEGKVLYSSDHKNIITEKLNLNAIRYSSGLYLLSVKNKKTEQVEAIKLPITHKN
jgi:photosystem II stability/assembly factor-like uncharacterized protein